MYDDSKYKVIEDQLKTLDKNICSKSTAIFKARLYHIDKPGSYHEVYRYDDNGVYGVFQLKPDDCLRGVPLDSIEKYHCENCIFICDKRLSPPKI